MCCCSFFKCYQNHITHIFDPQEFPREDAIGMWEVSCILAVRLETARKQSV